MRRHARPRRLKLSPALRARGINAELHFLFVRYLRPTPPDRFRCEFDAAPPVLEGRQMTFAVRL